MLNLDFLTSLENPAKLLLEVNVSDIFEQFVDTVK